MDSTEEPGPADAVLGHNSQKFENIEQLLAALITPDDLVDLLTRTNKGALDRTQELIDKGQKFLVIENDSQDEDATQHLVACRARWKQSEADRVAAKSPLDDLAGVVQAFFQRRILEAIALGPSRKDEPFDPVTRSELGIAIRIGRAQTIYKQQKEKRERDAREAEAARLRKIEEDARAAREAERKRLADEAARLKKIEDDRLAAEAAERKRIADAAAAAAADAAAAAARKRNADNKAAADAAAAKAAKEAEDARLAQEEADRVAQAEAAERQRIADQEAAEREEADRAEENRIAEQRAAAEKQAAAPAADLTRARGKKGGVSSLREFTNFRDLNRDQLAEVIPGQKPGICMLLPFIKDAALETAVKDYKKANKFTVMEGIKNGKQPVHGVIYFVDSKSAGRG